MRYRDLSSALYTLAACLLFAAVSVSTALGASKSAKDEKPQSFSFVALGDLHFDRLEHHDREWLAREHPGDVRQVQDYTRITRDTLPRLFAEVRETVAASPHRVAFIAQMRDLLEGLCGNPALARQHAEDALAFVHDARLGAPFLITKGNHDITGPSARDTYNHVLLPYLGEAARQNLQSASFTIQEEDSLFVFFDAYQTDLSWLEQTVASRKFRHLFVFLHPPVVPFTARSLWHLYAAPGQQPRRERLLNLLGRHHAVVICGHLHEYGLVVRQTGEGRFVQLALSSVFPAADTMPTEAISGLDHYGPDLVKREPQFDPQSEAQRRQALQAEAPFVKQFETAHAPGYAVLTVQGDRVQARIYSGLGRRLWKTLDLAALLADHK